VSNQPSPARALALRLVEKSKTVGRLEEAMLLVAQAQVYATIAIADDLIEIEKRRNNGPNASA
jgi:hypothetical protein